MEDIQLEHAFLKAPCELMTKAFRSRKKMLTAELKALTETIEHVHEDASLEQMVAVAEKLLHVSAAFEKAREAELSIESRVKVRWDHLLTRPKEKRGGGSLPAKSTWNRVRLDRMLVDYMLREGMYSAAEMLTQQSGLQALVELDLFAASRSIIESLKEHDCSLALQWCADNKRRLAKIDSSLEFRLRLQEFVELARARRKFDAIDYARTHLSLVTLSEDRFAEVQRTMALLAFPPTTTCQPYKDMYDSARWGELVRSFNSENYRLHGLPPESTLEIVMKGGLATLKTRQCGDPASYNPSCPTCVQPYLTLARDLPRAQHVHSVLVCSISREVMDENNPPMALPNGNVYSKDALFQIAESNNGEICDPRTGDCYRLSDLRKCYIM